MRTSALLGAKNVGFFEIYVLSARTKVEGVEPVRRFCGQGGRRSIFCDFVRTYFMDGILCLKNMYTLHKFPIYQAVNNKL